MAELFVVNSKIKEAVKVKGKSMSSDFPEKLSKKVGIIIDDAIERANDNGRQTVMAKDV